MLFMFCTWARDADMGSEDELTFNQIVSKIHALAASFRAVNDLLEDRLKSRNVHSEIVFSLSPNNNVSSSNCLLFPFHFFAT